MNIAPIQLLMENGWPKSLIKERAAIFKSFFEGGVMKCGMAPVLLIAKSSLENF
jgi:hypothetical protein